MLNTYYVVIDQDSNIWEKSANYKSSKDYNCDRTLLEMKPKDLKTLKSAEKFKKLLDAEVGSTNDFIFSIKPVFIDY